MLTTFIADLRRCIAKKDNFLGLTQSATARLKPKMPAKNPRGIKPTDIATLSLRTPVFPVNHAGLRLMPTLGFMHRRAVGSDIQPPGSLAGFGNPAARLEIVQRLIGLLQEDPTDVMSQSFNRIGRNPGTQKRLNFSRGLFKTIIHC